METVDTDALSLIKQHKDDFKEVAEKKETTKQFFLSPDLQNNWLSIKCLFLLLINCSFCCANTSKFIRCVVKQHVLCTSGIILSIAAKNKSEENTFPLNSLDR